MLAYPTDLKYDRSHLRSSGPLNELLVKSVKLESSRSSAIASCMQYFIRSNTA